MPRAPSPCASKTVRLPNWKADGRGVPRGGREVVPVGRYALGGPVSPWDGEPMTCLAVADGQAATGSRCFSEHSRKRKNCNILVDDALRLFPLNFYVWKMSPLFDGGANSLPLVCPVSTISGEAYNVDSRVNDPPAGSHLLLGPYPIEGTRRTAVKCIARRMLEHDNFVFPPDFGNGPTPQYVWNAANQFWMQFWTLENETMVPTPDMLMGAYLRLAELGLVDRLGSMRAAGRLQSIMRTLGAAALGALSPSDLKKARLLARLLFHLGMYLYRWAGPGRPYPITEERSTRPPGAPNNPISDSLVGKMVTSSASGVRVVTRGNHPPADEVNSENRLGNMENACLMAAGELYESLSEATKRKVRNYFRCGTPMRFCDGSGYVVDSYSMLDVCFGTPESPHRAFIARGDYCVRMGAKRLITGVLTVTNYLYKSPPAWTRFEGDIDPFIDPGDPSDYE
jgi:hypothetical protein